jgi:putative ubiquitin-RnfH superfamily antitoxin RatB of RatAB toxin-antitoxin module
MGDPVPAQPMITVEVAIALPERQEILVLEVRQGCTALEAVTTSGFREKYSDYLPEGKDLALGIFSRPMNGVVLPLPDSYILEDQDRVEIYRPLENDPKQARMERVAKARREKERK